MNNSNLPGMDEIKMLGMPYHGLWKAGSITLPNATTKTCPAPGNGGVVMLKVPGQPAVSRSPAELATDAADGKEWRNYGLLSGGRFGGSAPLYAGLGTAVVVLIDDSNACWLMHITWAAAETFMRVKLRRFMRIEEPWAEQAWSSTINVTTDPFFRAALNDGGFSTTKLLTVAQNSTGREFVLGGVSVGSAMEYCNGLIKINVSGSVDLSAAGFGLAFTGTILGGILLNGDRVTPNEIVESYGSAGDFTVTGEIYCEEWNSTLNGGLGGYTGASMTKIVMIITNGSGIYSEPIPPAHASGSPFSWDPKSISYSSSDARTSFYQKVTRGRYPLWAGYHNDVLKMLEMDYEFFEQNDTAVLTFVNHTSTDYGGGFPMILAKTSTARHSESSCEITYTYGGVVIAHRKNVYADDSVVLGSILPGVPDPTSTTTTPGTADQTNVAILMRQVDLMNSLPVPEVPVAFPLTVSGIPWSTPCIASVNRLGGTAPFTWQTIKVTAPSGTSASTSIAMATLGASWDPASDQLAVDSVPVCWF